MDIEQLPLGDLHQDPGNVRLHDERNLEAIRESLDSFGQVESLVVQQQAGRVIGGNGRLEAMQQLRTQGRDLLLARTQAVRGHPTHLA